MTVLAIDCSATPASAAVIRDGKIITDSFVNVKLTHSETLLPMLENMMKNARLTLDEIDCYAISNGPGSFTGIRIGISAVKGLAAPQNISCVAVSTLESMAYNLLGYDCIVCALMDARCNQFYNAFFRVKGDVVTRLCEDRALLFEDILAHTILLFGPCLSTHKQISLQYLHRTYPFCLKVPCLEYL